MTKAKEIYDSLVVEFPSSLQEISILSRNDSGNKNFIVSDFKAFNFDTIWNLGSSQSKKEKSPDSLFYHDDTLYFVEFKEGSCDRAEIRQKIHEGIVTLFQFATAKSIVDRETFFQLKIKYAVVKRGSAKGATTFLAALEESQDYFGLKNMEGLLVRDTTVRWNPESIFKLLQKITNGAIASIEYVTTDQQLSIKYS